MTPERPLGGNATTPEDSEATAKSPQNPVDSAMEYWRRRLPRDTPGGDLVYFFNPFLARRLLRESGVKFPTLSERLLNLGDRLVALVRKKPKK